MVELHSTKSFGEEFVDTFVGIAKPTLARPFLPHATFSLTFKPKENTGTDRRHEAGQQSLAYRTVVQV
jgi:hypothetical protein